MNEQPQLTIDAEGTKYWLLNGKYHRLDGPAFEHPNGHKEWYVNGLLHRINGPAIEYTDGVKCWFLNGRRHREDGPAYEHPDGSKRWFLNGERLSYEKWKALCNPFNMAFISNNASCPTTDSPKIFIVKQMYNAMY